MTAPTSSREGKNVAFWVFTMTRQMSSYATTPMTRTPSYVHFGRR
ncbi:MAG: hypothetical protein ACK5MP_10730 [Nostocoides sp.]